MVTRRSPVIWATPLLGALEYVNLANSRAPVLHHWTTLIDVANGVLAVMNPLTAGLACAASLALFARAPWEMVSATLDGGWRAVAAQAASVAVWPSAVHGATLVTLIALGFHREIPGLPPLLPVIPALTSLLAFSALGVAVARWWRSWAAPPVVAVGAYLLTIAVDRAANDAFVQFGGATMELLGLRHRPDVLAAQVVWTLSVAAAAVTLGCLRALSRRDGLLKVGAMVLVVAAGASALVWRGEPRFEDGHVTWRCAGAAPRVCVVLEYEEALPEQQQRVTRVVQVARELGLRDIPDTFRQAVGVDTRSGSDVGAFSIDDNLWFINDLSDVFQSAIACSDRWRGHDFRRLDTVLTWAVTEAGEPGAGGLRSPSESAARSAVRVLQDSCSS